MYSKKGAKILVLTFPVFIQSFSMFLFVLINLVCGLKIAFKYFETNALEMLLIGVAWIGLALLWIADAYKFIYNLFYDSPTLGIVLLNLILVMGLIPIPVILWVAGFTILLNLRKKAITLVVIGIGVTFLILEILLFSTFLNSPTASSYHFSSIYNYMIYIICLLLVLITGIIFSVQALKSKTKKIQIKGKLLLFAFILFTIGALIDTIFTYDDFLINMSSRVILILSSLLFYTGFMLPQFLWNLFSME